MESPLANKKTLAEQIANDDRRAFDLFYELYYDQIFRFARYFLNNTEACREVITEVYVSIWKTRKSLPAIEKLETYLYVVTRNECNRYLKQHREERMVSTDEIPVCIEHTGKDTPEDILLYEEMEKLLSEAVSTLPEKCRLIFLMAREEELKPREIASILSISENTVRVQIKTATDRIIEIMKKHFPHLSYFFISYFTLKL